MADLSLEMQRTLQARAFLQRYEALGPASSYSLGAGDTHRDRGRRSARSPRSTPPD
jgi:hypothetical protein